jgi:hypothetical protein
MMDEKLTRLVWIRAATALAAIGYAHATLAGLVCLVLVIVMLRAQKS